MSNVKRLAVFFDNLQYFSSSTVDAIDVVDCSSSMSSTTTCYGYKGQAITPLQLNSLHTLNRVEIDVEGIISGTSIASPFQILIPVKSIPNLGSINLQFATLTTDFYYGIYKPYTSILNTFNTFYQSTFSVNTVITDITKIKNINYKLSFSTNPVVGKIASPIAAVINCGHDNVVPANVIVNSNTAPYYGAGFTYISQYNMIGSGFYASSNLINTQITSECCLPFSYTYLTTKKYGFFCPFNLHSISSSSILTALNFLYPYQNGQKIVDNTYGLWSDKTGLLISAQWHDNSGVSELFLTGSITLTLTGVTPPLIKGVANQQLLWNFTTSNPIPINGIIKVTFSTPHTWSFTPDITEKCILKAQLLANDRNHNCAINKLTNNYITFTFSASTSDLSPFPTGSYSLIQYGVDKDATTGINLAFTLGSFTSLSSPIDASSLLAGSLQFSNVANPAALTVSNVVIQTLTTGFRDDFSFQFTVTNKEIFFNEILYINLGILATSTISSQIICSIDESTISSFDWLGIDTTDLTKIMLFPKADISQLNKLYTLTCEGIYIPASNTPGLVMTLFHQTTLSLSSNTASYPQFTSAYNGSIASTNCTLIKSFNAYGHPLELIFNITLGNDINHNQSIIVNLPIYYNRKEFITCWINDVPVFCYYPRIHTIIIEGLDLNVTAWTSFLLTIYGILNPEISFITTRNTFLIGFNQTNDPTLLSYIAEISDIINQIDSIGSITIAHANISNNYILRQSNLYIYFDYMPIDISPSQQFVLDLLDYESYGFIMQKSKFMTCELVNQSSSSGNLISSCVMKGLRIKFTLSGYVNQTTQYLLIISGLPNPEYINCNIRKPIITILDIDNMIVLYRSNAISENIPTLFMKSDPTLQYTYWQDTNGNIIKHNQDVFEVTIGTYSPIINLYPFSKPFFKFMGLNVIQFTNNTLWPILSSSSGSGIKIGDFNYGFRIGCPQGMSQQVIEYLVYKIEPGHTIYYSVLEQLSVSLLTQQFVVETDRYSYSVFNLGSSLPLIFDFTEKSPYNYLLINFTIFCPGIDLGYVFKATNTTTQFFNVTYTTPISKLIILSTQNATLSPGMYGQVIITLMAGNVNSYAVPTSPIMLYPVIGSNTTVPIINIIYNAYSSSATQHQIIVQTSDFSSIYCYVALVLQDSFTRDFNYTRTMADDGYTIQTEDRYQEQFFVWYIEDFSISYTFKITKLKSKKSYNFVCWAMNLFGNASSSFSGMFTTLDNGGKLMRFGLSFLGELDISSKQFISCYLCSYFAIPCQK